MGNEVIDIKNAVNPIKGEPFPFLISNNKNKALYPNRFVFEKIHYHEDLEFTFVAHGCLKIQMLDGEIEVNENEVIYINKNVGHRLLPDEKVVFQSYIFPENVILDFNDFLHNKFVSRYANDAQLEYQIFKNGSPVLIAIKQLRNYVKKETERYTYELDMLSIIYKIWSEFIREQIAENRNNVIVSSIQRDRLQRAIAYIHENFNKAISLDTIAAHCFIGKSELFRMFKKAFGMSPYEYTLECKINKSLELLSTTNLSISEIASQLGYNTQSQFAQQFKQRVGDSPSNYRKTANYSGQ